MKKAEYLFDVFISHAVEDKIGIANDLYKALTGRGLKVWYSSIELTPGDRLAEAIHTSLDQSRFGVVIFSPTYISKIWALNEFFFLLKREAEGEKVILPVLYDITPEQLAVHSPLMANMFAARFEKGIDHVTEFLVTEISKQRKIKPPIASRGTRLLRLITTGLTALSVVVAGILTYAYRQQSPSESFIESAIKGHVAKVQQTADNDVKLILQNEQAIQTSIEKVQKVYADYINVDSHYRNEYTLNTVNGIYQSKKRVAALLGPGIEDLTPLKNFNFSQLTIFQGSTLGERESSYVVMNLEYPSYKVEKEIESEEEYVVHVRYSNNIRMVHTSLIFPTSEQDTKRFHLTITGLLPEETYHFTKKFGKWTLETIE